MRVLALNSSARTGSDSKTEIMLNALVDGMRTAGADVEVVNLKDKKIRVCSGCYTCWTKTPGKCIHNDDMTNELFGKWVDSDLCVLATPLFHHTVNATMKTFIERTLPVAEPYLQSFPLPADFFGLLLTGRFTLAECYAYTANFNSWMMMLLGDPLYRPFAGRAHLAIEDIYEPGAIPTEFKSQN